MPCWQLPSGRVMPEAGPAGIAMASVLGVVLRHRLGFDVLRDSSP